MFKQTTFYIEI